MLKGYVAPTKSVEVPGNDPLVLRGLGLHDIALIVRDYRPQLSAVFKQFEGLLAGKGVENLDLGNVITVAMQTAPLLVSSIIATAAGEPDAFEIVATLPVTVQLTAIETVGELTFQGEGGSKKVFEAVLRLIQGVGGLVSTSPKARPRQGEITIGKDGMPTSEPA